MTRPLVRTPEAPAVGLTPIDRDLLKRCLAKAPGSWNDFVDRFLSLIYHVIGYTAHLRSVRLGPEDLEDIAAEVLLKIVADDFRLLRQFRGNASLATYLTVVARRITIGELARRQNVRDSIERGDIRFPEQAPDASASAQQGLESLEEVEKLLRRLSGKERDIVRLYYLEGRTYEEISTETDVPVNSIGAVLTRARKKLREGMKQSSDATPVLPPRAKAKKPPAVSTNRQNGGRPKPKPPGSEPAPSSAEKTEPDVRA